MHPFAGLRPFTVALALVLVAFAVVLSIGGSGGSEPSKEDSAEEGRLGRLGLVDGPPPNLLDACAYVASQTPLAWQCPPVVPEGTVEIHPSVLKRQPRLRPFMSLTSESLGGVRSPIHRGHWVIYAGKPARDVRAPLYWPAGVPDGPPPPRGQVPQFEVDGVRVEVLRRDGPTLGINKDHAVVYWQIKGTGFVVSVHGHANSPVAKEIARWMIRRQVGGAQAVSDVGN